MVQAGRPALCASPETAGHEAHHSKALMRVKSSFTHIHFSPYLQFPGSHKFEPTKHINNQP